MALNAIKEDGLLWISYPKKTSKIKTDIGGDVMTHAGYDGVSLISINETWSAIRFRPKHKVKTSRKKTGALIWCLFFYSLDTNEIYYLGYS
jgi:hypothetical protein